MNDLDKVMLDVESPDPSPEFALEIMSAVQRESAVKSTSAPVWLLGLAALGFVLLAMVVISLATKSEDARALDEFYILLRTPVGEEHRLKAAGIETIHEIEKSEDAGPTTPDQRRVMPDSPQHPDAAPSPDDDSVAAALSQFILG